MTDWSPAEERDFQRLVRQAEQQSQEYYRRAGGAPGHSSQGELSAKPPEPPPPPPPPTPEPPLVLPTPTAAPRQPKRYYRVRRKNPLPMLDIDSETAVLVALLWLLWQEQADIKVILAIVYILIV